MTHEHEYSPRWTRAFLWTPVAMLGVFGSLTFFLTNKCLTGPDGPHSREWYVWWTTIATPLGPLTGGIVRDWQSCCAANAWVLAAETGPILAAGIALQFVLRGEGRAWLRARLAIWSVAWFIWLGSGIAALGHSLE